MGCPRFLLTCSFLLLVSPIALRAQSAPSSSSVKSKNSRSTNTSGPDAGATTDGLYRNSFFAFSYKVPFGWVERTKDIQGDDADSTKSQVLLAVFERPPDAPGDTVNSAVVIAAEKAANYPGLKTAADYFGPLGQLTIANGFKVVNEPYEFPVGTKKLARADFSKPMNNDKLTMQQSTLVELEHGYVVSFTFIAGDEGEVEDLIGNLSFAVHK